MADETIFTIHEVKRKLAELGYADIPDSQMLLFVKDLNELVMHETSKSSAYDTSTAGEYSEGLSDYDEQRESEISRKKLLRRGTNQNHLSREDKENFGYGERFPLKKSVSVSSFLSESSDSSATNTTQCSGITRRKVARKRDGVTRIFDETQSDIDSEAADITLLEDRLRLLPLREGTYEDNDESESTCTASATASGRGYLPSYIRPSTAIQNEGRCRRYDPVIRYHQFKREWKHQKVPGESKHESARWNVRERMLQSEVYERARHNLQRNNYQVPTGKKRQALRWQVRCALAKSDYL